MPLLGQVLEKYPKEVRIVHKNFPLANHPYARTAALAAAAAFEQGKFWELYEAFLQNSAQLNDQKIKELASAAGLDMKRFEESLADPNTASLVDRDIRDAAAAGVRGTPTIFVNGRLLQNRSLEGFSDLIDRALKKTAAAPKP